MIVALVGLCGAGKSEASRYFEDKNYENIYFGGLTMEELKKRGLEVNESNEKKVREELRQEHGMAAYAVLSLPKIKNALKNGKNVLIDGLYSWSEYKVLKKEYPEIKVVAIYTYPALRYERLAKRINRPLSEAHARSRDFSEIENLEKGGPIAMADFTVINNGTINDLLESVGRIFK